MQTNNRSHLIDENLSHFLSQHRIDSFSKVWFLLFLWQRNEHSVNRAFARMSTFTDAQTLDDTIEDLEKFGLLRIQDDQCILRQGADIETGIASMLQIYEDPIARQQLLNRLYRRTNQHYD